MVTVANGEPWRRPVQSQFCAREGHRAAHALHPFGCDLHPARHHLFIGEDLVDRIDGAAGNGRGLERHNPLRGGPRLHGLHEQRNERGVGEGISQVMHEIRLAKEQAWQQSQS